MRSRPSVPRLVTFAPFPAPQDEHGTLRPSVLLGYHLGRGGGGDDRLACQFALWVED